MKSTLVREFLSAVRTTVFPPTRRRSAARTWGAAIVEIVESRVLLSATTYQNYLDSVATADATYSSAAQDAASGFDTAMLNANLGYHTDVQSAWDLYDTVVNGAHATLETASNAAGDVCHDAMDAVESDAWSIYSGTSLMTSAMGSSLNTAGDESNSSTGSSAAVGSDSDRRNVLQNMNQTAARNELIALFSLIDKAGAKMPINDSHMGPCGTFAAAFDALIPKGEHAFRHITVLHQQAAIFDAQWTVGTTSPFYGYADYHEYFVVKVRVPDPEICGRFISETTFYIDTGTHLNGHLTSNAGGPDNIFVGPLPGDLHPLPAGMPYFEWDDIIRGVK